MSQLLKKENMRFPELNKTTSEKEQNDISSEHFSLKIEPLPNITDKPSLDDLLSSRDISIMKETSREHRPKNSRFYENFEELENLGKGAFGEVVKVRYFCLFILIMIRNKLDGRFYAVKKIVIRQGHKLTRIMREVQTLSRLHHQNILRYYQAWIEEAPE
jgi:hypothetical protein